MNSTSTGISEVLTPSDLPEQGLVLVYGIPELVQQLCEYFATNKLHLHIYDPLQTAVDVKQLPALDIAQHTSGDLTWLWSLEPAPLIVVPSNNDGTTTTSSTIGPADPDMDSSALAQQPAPQPLEDSIIVFANCDATILQNASLSGALRHRLPALRNTIVLMALKTIDQLPAAVHGQAQLVFYSDSGKESERQAMFRAHFSRLLKGDYAGFKRAISANAKGATAVLLANFVQQTVVCWRSAAATAAPAQSLAMGCSDGTCSSDAAVPPGQLVSIVISDDMVSITQRMRPRAIFDMLKAHPSALQQWLDSGCQSVNIKIVSSTS